METLRTHPFSVRFKNVHIACCYECPPNRVNVFERGITLPGRPEVSLAATTPCRLQLSTVLLIWKGKVRPITGHEGPEGEEMYSSTLSLTSAIDGVDGQRNAPAPLPPEKTPYQFYRRVGGPQGRSDGCGKFHLQRDSIPAPSSL